ncbi:MAG: hypothetical protein ACLTZY_13500 [Alistipes indistinctus]
MKKLFAAFILCAFTSLGLSARTQNDRPVTLKGHAVTGKPGRLRHRVADAKSRFDEVTAHYRRKGQLAPWKCPKAATG